MSEDNLQAKCYQWFHNSYPELRGLLWAVPNGGHRDVREAMKFKATGVVAGVPDLEFHYKGRSFFFELKTEKGIVSEKQKRIHQRLKENGFTVTVIREFEKFKTELETVIQNGI